MEIKRLIFNGREIIVSSPGDTVIMTNSFAALVSAECQKDLKEILSISSALLDGGCKEFCCAGELAELLHDQMDQIIESKNLFYVVTTWHESYVDACEYFVFASGGQEISLLALVNNNPELLEALKSVVQAG